MEFKTTPPYNMQVLEEYSTEYIFNLIKNNKKSSKEVFITDFGTFEVKVSSHRFVQFKKQNFCVCCGLVGNIFKLERSLKENPHLNFYNRTQSMDILFTKDHIVPKSLNGKDSLENYQTMCVICNNIKSNFDVDLEILKKAKTIFDSGVSRNEIEKFLKNEQKNKKT